MDECIAEVARVEIRNMLESVQAVQQNMNLSLEGMLKALGKTMEDYNKALHFFCFTLFLNHTKTISEMCIERIPVIIDNFL